MKISTLTIEMAANVARLRQDMESARRTVEGSTKSMGNAARQVRNVLGTIGVGFSMQAVATSFLRTADAATTLQNRLRLVHSTVRDQRAAYDGLFASAQSSRVSFTELGATYAAIARNGGPQDQILKVTGAIANAMTISGGSADSMKAALVQLGQGMASGVLRGEELNSVMEQTPRLAKAIADGMGLTIGQLREAGKAGELTADAVTRALLSQADVLKNEVTSALMTAAQGYTVLGNSATNLIGKIDQATSVSSTFAEALVGVSKVLDFVASDIEKLSSEGGLRQAAADVQELSKRATALQTHISAGFFGPKVQADLDATNERLAVARKRFNDLYREMRGGGAGASTGVGSVGSGDTALLRAQRAQWDAMAGTRAKYMEGARTDVQKLNEELDKARTAFGGVIPAEVEASLRAKFIKPIRQAKTDTEAARLELQLYEQEMAQFTAAEELVGEQNRLNREMTQQAIADARELYAEQQKAFTDSTASAQKRLEAFEQETTAIYLSEAAQISMAQAVELTTIARLEEAKVAAMGSEEAVLAIQAEIDARQKLAQAINSRDVKDASTKAAKEAADAWAKTASDIEDTLTDALMRGFESGESFGDNLAESITNTFKTYVAREISKAITKAILSALAQTQWGSALSGLMGGVTGGGGGADWLSMAYKGYQYVSGGTAAAGAAGGGAAAGGTAAGGAAAGGGGASAGIGAMGWAAIIVAAIYAGNKLYEAGYNKEVAETSSLYDNSFEKQKTNLLEMIGLSEKWSTILGGSTRFGHMFGTILRQQGMRGNFDGAGGIQTDAYQTYRRGWAAGGGEKVVSSPLEAGRAASLTAALADVQDSTEVLVRAMGGNADAVRAFAGGVTIDLRGLTQSEASKKMAEEFQDLQYRMAEAAGISREAFQGIIDSVNASMERAGINAAAISDVLIAGMTGRLTEAEVGTQLADIIIGGIYNSISSSYADQISSAFTSQIIQPLLTAALMGAPLAGVVSQQAIAGVVATAQNAAAQLNAIFSDAGFRDALNQVQSAIKGVSAAVVKPARSVRSFGSAALAAGEAARRAAEEQLRAAEEIKRAWQQITESIIDEIRRIRGEVLGSGPDGVENLQARFAILTAQARAGSQDAAEQLPGLSRDLIELARETSATLSDFRAVQGSTLASLEATARYLSSRYGFTLPSFAVGTNEVPQDMLAMVHKGEAIVPAKYNNGGNEELVAEVRALKGATVANAAATDRLEQGMKQFTNGYQFSRTKEVTA